MRAWWCLVLATVFSSMTLPATAEQSYELNAILPLSGGASFLGTKEAESLHAIENLVNATGGIKGQRLHFVIADDASNPQNAVQIASALIARNVPVILGSAIAGSCSAVAPLVQNGGPVMYCFSPAIETPRYGYVFASAPAISEVVPVVLRYLRRRGLRRPALITSTDASGSDFERRLNAALAEPEFKSVQFVAREQFNPADLSVTGQLNRIKSAVPDVLLTFAVGTPFGTLLHGINEVGLDVPVYASGGNMTYAQMAQYAEMLPRELFMNAAHGVGVEPSATVRERNAQQLFATSLTKSGVRPEFAHNIAWDPTWIIVSALRRLGPDTTATSLHGYLEHLAGFVGIEGSYDFRFGDQRGIGAGAVALYAWQPALRTFALIGEAGRLSASRTYAVSHVADAARAIQGRGKPTGGNKGQPLYSASVSLARN